MDLPFADQIKRGLSVASGCHDTEVAAQINQVIDQHTLLLTNLIHDGTQSEIERVSKTFTGSAESHGLTQALIEACAWWLDQFQILHDTLSQSSHPNRTVRLNHIEHQLTDIRETISRVLRENQKPFEDYLATTIGDITNECLSDDAFTTATIVAGLPFDPRKLPPSSARQIERLRDLLRSK